MGEAPMEIDAVYGEKGKKVKHGKGKKGKDKGKGKHKGKHESSPKFEGYCGHCGKWGHKQKDTVDTRTPLLRWMMRSLLNLQTVMRAVTRIESHLHLLVCFQLEPRVHDWDDLHVDGGSRAIWMAMRTRWEIR